MTEQPPHIEFPCLYPITVIMAQPPESDQTQVEAVVDIVHDHAEAIDRGRLSLKPSRQGNYVSVRLEIVATGEVQLKALHSALLTLSYVKLVL